MSIPLTAIAQGMALVSVIALSGIAGYRYADGRCAIERLREQDTQIESLYAALEQARLDAKTAQGQVTDAAKKLSALDARQQKERTIYVKAPPAPDCRLDDGAFGLLVDAVRKANGDGQNAPD